MCDDANLHKNPLKNCLVYFKTYGWNYNFQKKFSIEYFGIPTISPAKWTCFTVVDYWHILHKIYSRVVHTLQKFNSFEDTA